MLRCSVIIHQACGCVVCQEWRFMIMIYRGGYIKTIIVDFVFNILFICD